MIIATAFISSATFAQVTPTQPSPTMPSQTPMPQTQPEQRMPQQTPSQTMPSSDTMRIAPSGNRSDRGIVGKDSVGSYENMPSRSPNTGTGKNPEGVMKPPTKKQSTTKYSKTKSSTVKLSATPPNKSRNRPQ